MIFSNFIASRLSQQGKGAFSAVISRIAVGSVASGIFIILISYAILLGFQRNIKNKIFSFGGHIQLTKYDQNNSLQESPISINTEFISKCKANPNISNINTYSLKAGLIKTENEVLGTVLKGVDKDFNLKAFSPNIIEGRFFNFTDSSGSKEILISEKMARKLKIKLGDHIVMYFVQNPPRFRKLAVVGLFNTGMDEFDESFMLGDIQLIKRINNWDNTLAGGYEIMINDFDRLNAVAEDVFAIMDYDIGMEKITDKYITVFDWLTLLDQNVRIFLLLIIAVACFNMISSLFIMIMERTQMIGILKALGAGNNGIMYIFFFRGMKLIVYGLILGNIAAAMFCYAQYKFQLLPLDPENYYMSSVPIEWNWTIWIFANLYIFLVMSLIVYIPCLAVARINPVRAIRFD